MAGLNIYTSNRLEVLSHRLAEVISTPPPDVFEKEMVIVQSRGMARWLGYELARHHSICANVEFPFPRAFAYQLLARLNESTSLDSPWDPEVLLWRVMKVLPGLLNRREFDPLKAYVSGENSELRLYQLSAKIAHTFDQYVVFRPELVLGWDAGEENHWQAILWRELTKQTTAFHAAKLQQSALEALRKEQPSLDYLPHRICLFGMSVLPKFYLDLLAALAAHREVNLFLVQPTKESWDHITSRRESDRITERTGLSELDLHLEEGHPLLASWGKQGREFYANVLECQPQLEQSDFIESNGTSMLHRLQDDILHLQTQEGKNVIAREDTSIQVHSCHTPIRELEVLRDYLLSWFQEDPTLRPRDILVMMPDVESYTPLIEAVFDVPEEKGERIPFSIADRSARHESHIAETFLSILNLPESRCTTREILAFLDCRSLLARFGLAEDDVDLIQRWIMESGIRWGMDARHRTAFDLPSFDQNSWQTGLERLLLGYAMEDEADQLFQETLPVDGIEGSTAEILGRFTQFIKRLFKTCQQIRQPRSIDEWATMLLQIVNDFFQPDISCEEEMWLLREQCLALGTQQARSEFDGEIPLSVVRAHLKDGLERSGLAGGFLDGGVTFCALKPMRSLPFKVICLLGMNDTAFPRQDSTIGFDLLRQKPRPGDPSARRDDQYLFLETLLAARERLHISYIGQSIKDNKPLPPSVLVSELIEYLQRTFTLEDGPLTENDLIVKHRLQAFSPSYFKGERLFTFSRANFEALKAHQSDARRRELFVTNPLPEPSEEFRSVTISDLADFFSNPSKYFLRRRLGMDLVNEDGRMDEVEPFRVDGLNAFLLKQELLDKELRGGDGDRAFSLYQARGILPYGSIGKGSLMALQEEVKALADRVASQLNGSLVPLPFNRQIGGFLLEGELQVCASGQVQYRAAKLKGTDIVRAWIHHLALNLAQPGKGARRTVLIGMDDIIEFGPVSDPESVLLLLLDLYWQGLCRPLKFFPKSSHAYARATLNKGKDHHSALSAAAKEWFHNDYAHTRGEETDPWFHFCFPDGPPFDNEFEEISLRVFGPISTAGNANLPEVCK